MMMESHLFNLYRGDIKMEKILLIIELIYLIPVIITLILFRRGNLVIDSSNEGYNKFLQKHIIWFHITYSIGWPVPWMLVIYKLIRNKLGK